MLGAADSALDRLYPGRADPPLPRALPLGDYTGTYYHPAYMNLTIEPAAEGSDGGPPDGRRELRAARDDFVWKMTFEFGHVSGEFWLIYVEPTGSAGLGTQFARAEFQVGVTGKVESIEIEFTEDGSEGLILFKKIAQSQQYGDSEEEAKHGQFGFFYGGPDSIDRA